MEKVVQMTTQLDLDGTTWVAEWNSYIMSNGNETTDRWLKIYRKDGDKLTDRDDITDTYSADVDKIVDLFVAERVKAIQEEYNLPSSEVDELVVSEDILRRVWAGEWMGQLRNSYYFFIDNLASILGKDFHEAAAVVSALGARKIAGLNGFIIVPFKEEESAYASWEKSTGHKRLNVSDWGGWNCEHCGNSGDEHGPAAATVPCEKVGGQF